MPLEDPVYKGTYVINLTNTPVLVGRLVICLLSQEWHDYEQLADEAEVAHLQ